MYLMYLRTPLPSVDYPVGRYVPPPLASEAPPCRDHLSQPTCRLDAPQLQNQQPQNASPRTANRRPDEINGVNLAKASTAFLGFSLHPIMCHQGRAYLIA